MLFTPTLIVAAALAQPGAEAAPLDWKTEEAALLSDHTQLTFPDRFVKAGEAYFDHESPPRRIVFQAVPVPPEGQEPSPHYSMYVADLEQRGGQIVGIGEPLLVSSPGSANTCGWFHPTDRSRLIFGSTLVPPGDDDRSGFQVGTHKYKWQFPVEMDVVGVSIPAMLEMRDGAATPPKPTPVFSRPMYDAECSFSPDGRFILYSHVRQTPHQDGADEGAPDGDIWIYDTTTQTQTPLVQADGYDGGPFFSPDGTWICFRSDRRGDSELQLFTAELTFDESGACTGIKREVQLTDNSHVNWAPYWHPSSRDGKGVLIYTTSQISHRNYEVFAIEADPAKPADQLRTRRITAADGFDGLPVFSGDGQWMMWTSQRGEKLETEDRPSSQIWIARMKQGAFESTDQLFDSVGSDQKTTEQ
jgi:hypothetical protein